MAGECLATSFGPNGAGEASGQKHETTVEGERFVFWIEAAG
ncbi:MAG: hypothetical protein M5U28_08975 [Sandaracinaceae bacterium]|nr:hypothetical protein [Sandaracinaceae bacterium]